MTKLTTAIIACVLLPSFVFWAIAANTGDLQITCKPGIRIYLDDEFVGVTKSEEDGLYLEDVDAGTHEIRAEKSDFTPKKFTIEIKAGKTIELQVGELTPKVKIKQEGESGEGTIKAQVGKVIITSVPLRCEISFLDQDIQKTKDRVMIEDIPVGIYPIIFKRRNETLKAELEIKTGMTLEVKGHFRQNRVLIKEQPRDDVEMVLILAGEFQMGSNIDEAANVGGIHTVYLDAYSIH